MVQLALKSYPSNSKFKLSATCLSQTGKNNIRDGSRRVWVSNTIEGGGGSVIAGICTERVGDDLQVMGMLWMNK